jgi:hypothetical protein
MPYEFNEIDMFAFDVHFTLKPLIRPDLLRASFRFLVDPTLYKQQYTATPVETNTFVMQPIRVRSRKRDRFWKYYGTSTQVASSDSWGLQLPFVCKMKTAVTVGMRTSFRVSVRPVIYLFPLGWSAQLEFAINGNIGPKELIDFVGAVRSASQRPFKFNQKEYSLPKLFDAMAAQLKKEIFVDPNSAEDLAKTPRHIVVSLSQFSGPVQYYRPQFATDSRMPDADRTLIHSILLGTEIAIIDLAKKEREKTFMLTRFGGANFAVSYFDIGTLLFMQQEAKPEQHRRESIRCIASNIRKCSMSILALLAFHEELTDIEKPEGNITALEQIMKSRLCELPKRYNNALCTSWYQNYGRLSPFVKSSKTGC